MHVCVCMCRLHIKELQNNISVAKAQHHEELTKARSVNEQLQNDIKIKEMVQSEKLAKSELFVKQLENDAMALKVKHSEELMQLRSDEDLRQTMARFRTNIISVVKAQHHEELTKARSVNEQLQNDIKIKEMAQSEKLAKSELLIKQLENDAMALKVKHSEELMQLRSDEDLRQTMARFRTYIISVVKAQHHEELTKARSVNEQLQNDMKIKVIEQSEKLTKSELLVKQLENDIMALKIKHSEELIRVKSDDDLREAITTSLQTYIVNVIKAQNHEELTNASYSSLIVQLQNDIKDLKVKETEHLEKLTQSELLVKQLQDDNKDLKVKETEHLEKLTQSELLVKQLQDDNKDLKVKETEHLEKLTQSELLVKQLQDDNKDLKVKETEHLEKLTQSELLVKQLQDDNKDLKVKETEHLEKLTQSELLVKQLQDDNKDLKVKETEHLENLTQSELLVKDLKVKETEKLTQSQLFVKQLQDDNKDLKVKEMEQSQKLKQFELLVTHLESDVKALKAKHSETLTQLSTNDELRQARLQIKKLQIELKNTSSLIEQLQDDIRDPKVKEMKQSEKLTQSESLAEQLESYIEVLKAKHSENLSDKLAQTESKLKYLLSSLESVYISYNNNNYMYEDKSLWQLILFMSNEISDQVAPAVILKMSNFTEIKKKKNWHDNSFFAFHKGYQMRLIVYAAGADDGKGTHVSVYLQLMNGPHDDKLEQSGYWPLRGTFRIELLNQVSDDNHHSSGVQFHHHFCNDCSNRVLQGVLARRLGIPQFISHKALLDHKNKGYYKNDSLMFRISYEHEQQYRVAPVTFKVTHFLSQWLKNKGTWYSSLFFAFAGGYQMFLEVHATGDSYGEGTHVSVYLYLTKGPHDDKLKQSGYWPLQGYFTIELLNQSQPRHNNHHSYTARFDTLRLINAADRIMDDDYAPIWGASQFISHEILLNYKHDFIECDTVYFRVTYQAVYWEEIFWRVIIIIALISLVICCVCDHLEKQRKRYNHY